MFNITDRFSNPWNNETIVDAVTKSNNDNIEKQEPVKNNYFKKRKRWNIKQIEESIAKSEHCNISKLINNSTVWKFVTKKWIELNYLSSGQYSLNINMTFKTSMLRSNMCD